MTHRAAEQSEHTCRLYIFFSVHAHWQQSIYVQQTSLRARGQSGKGQKKKKAVAVAGTTYEILSLD